MASFYIWAIRGTPLLVQILFVHFALPVLVPGLNLPDFAAAVVALSNVGAYNAEAIRAGLLAVPRGQTEAARALGLGHGHVFLDVVFPQAFKIALPPLVKQLCRAAQDSSLAYAIGVVELDQRRQPHPVGHLPAGGHADHGGHHLSDPDHAGDAGDARGRVPLRRRGRAK